MRDTSTQTQNRPPPEIAPIKTLNVGLRSPSPSNHAPAQGFPKRIPWITDQVNKGLRARKSTDLIKPNTITRNLTEIEHRAKNKIKPH
jgi:hypothetical protein